MSSSPPYSLRPNAKTYFIKQIITRIDRNILIISTISSAVSDAVVDDGNSDEETLRRRGRLSGTHNIYRGESTCIEYYIKPNSMYNNDICASRFGIPKAQFMRLATKLQESFPEHC